MSQHGRLDPELPDDMLDELIRQSVRARAGHGEPPDRVWVKISNQVAAGPAKRRHQPPARQLSQLLAPLVQGLVATAVVLLLGFSLGPNLWVQSYQFGSRQEITPATEATIAEPTATDRAVAPQSFDPAVIEVAVAEVGHVEPAAVPPLQTSRDDMLSEGVLRGFEVQEALPAQEWFVQANDPAQDPVLANRRDMVGRH